MIEFIYSMLGEDELVFPPLSYFEVVGEPRAQQHGQHRAMVVRIRVNANVKHSTLEELLHRRKKTVMKVGECLLKEIMFDVRLVSKDDFSTSVFDKAMVRSEGKDPAWYDFDENFKDELDTLVRKKKRTIFKAVENWEGEGKLKVVLGRTAS
jgi:hypothetical protein